MEWGDCIEQIDAIIADAAMAYARLDRRLTAGGHIDVGEYARLYALSASLAMPRAVCAAHLRETRVNMREVTHAPVD